METYKIEEFTTGEWSDRPEYADESIRFDHITDLHNSCSDYQEMGKCGKTDIWFFLHMPNNVAFEFYLYSTNAWEDKRYCSPIFAEPFLWVYGTTFDGIRECSGGQNFTVSLVEQADALLWLQEFCCRRWPRFAEWYRLQ